MCLPIEQFIFLSAAMLACGALLVYVTFMVVIGRVD